MVKFDFQFEFLIYIILKSVQAIFREHGKNYKTLQLENESFSYTKGIYIWKVLFKLFNDILNDAESELYQKLLIRDVFPGRYSIRNIWSTENAKRYQKYFFESIFQGLSTDIDGES